MNAHPDSRAHSGTVTAREVLGEHLVRLTVEGLEGFTSTGIPDEWVALTVPGQYQNRYYTVRSWSEGRLVLDVVVHDEGLVTEWVRTDVIGDVVGISEPKGSFDLPPGAAWVVLVGDLTALPAIARIGASPQVAGAQVPVTAYVESPDVALEGYTDLDVTWVAPPAPEESGLAELVRGLDWPAGEGYFWMAGESAQMREIRRHVRQDLAWQSSAYDVMGYWSGSRGRQRRAADPPAAYANRGGSNG
ncbi:MAG: siderophore-interacting protein [Marmoricola sp.]